MTRIHFNPLIEEWGRLNERDLLDAVLNNDAGARVAVSSSFGAESAVLLGLVAEIDPTTPVITVDTGKLFAETLKYREQLADHLGLTGLRIETSPYALVDNVDPDGHLNASNPDLCCQVRKVMPHALAAANFDILITGRKRHHGADRSALPSVHVEGPHIKINPLSTWTEQQIEAAFQDMGLPRHPLVSRGYRSIGCATCTARTPEGENARAGRWTGHHKTECGLHTTFNDTFQFKFTEYGQ